MLGAHFPGSSVVMMATVTTHELAMGVFVGVLQWGIRTWQGRKLRREGTEVDDTGVDENRIPARLCARRSSAIGIARNGVNIQPDNGWGSSPGAMRNSAGQKRWQAVNYTGTSLWPGTRLLPDDGWHGADRRQRRPGLNRHQDGY